MQGTYRITIGNETYEYKNIITNQGKLGILNAVAGKRTGLVSSLCVGVGSTAADAADTRLNYMTGGTNLTAVVVDTVNEKIYYKGSLPQTDYYRIYELGSFDVGIEIAMGNGVGSELVSFAGVTNWVDVAGTSYLDELGRIGLDARVYDVNNTTVKGNTALGFNFTSVQDLDKFNLAYSVTDLSSVILRFKNDDSNYFSFTMDHTNGYHTNAVNKSSATATGAPTWLNITTIEVEVTSTTTTGKIVLDSLRYDKVQPDNINFLSHVVLTDPIAKLPGIEADIEYVLELDV